MKAKKPISEFEELELAVKEFKKELIEFYIKSPMGKLSIWLLDGIEKYLNKKHKINV